MKSQNRHEQYRGIINGQGTACHTSSALQLIFHCFPDVRDTLLELAVASSDASTHSSDENDDRENNSAEKISNDKFSSIENGAIIRQQEFVYQLAWFFYLLKHAERVRVRTTKESSHHQQQGNDAEISPKVSTSDAKSKSGVRKTSKSSKRQLSARQKAAIAEFMTSVASQRSSRKNRKNRKNLNSASFGTDNVDANGENVEKSGNNIDSDEKDWNAIKEEKWRALVEIMREEEKQERLRQLEEQKQREQEERELMKDKNAKKYRESLHNVLGERSSGSVGSPGSIGASIPNEGMERRVDDSYRNDRYEESINGSKQNVGSLSYSVTPRLTPPTSRDRPSSHSHRPPNHNYHISTSNPIDPSEFYLYLTQYTNSLLESPSKGNQKGIIRIDTNNVADAAIIFRCLVSTLEFSVTMEIDRLNEALLHLQHEKEEVKFSEESWLQRIFGLLSQLKEKIQCEWNGALISRIVGKLVIASSDSETPNDDSSETPSTKIIQRTKRNGNIERPIPVPFPLPVINQRVSNSTDAAKPRSDSDKNGDGRNYFPSLVDSLRSITIEPNPIRGYDWTSMMKRGDVIEEKCAHHASAVNHMELNQSFEPGQRTSARTDRDGIDSETEEIVRAMEEMDMMQRNVDQCGIMGGGRREEGPSDKSNSTSKQETTSTIQSDEEIARTSIANNNTIRTVNSPIEKDAYYAEAVARLVARPQSVRGSLSSSRASSTSKNGRNSSRFRDSSSTIRYVSSFSNNEYLMSDVPVSPLLSPGANSLSGMEVGGIADSQLYASSDQRITMTYMPSPTNSYASSTDSDSEEESSIDSQVSSVHDSDSTPSCIDDDDIVAGLPGDESSETHSSAIETPSDIDELSLGSFTDDSLQENDFPDTKHSPPAVHMLGNKITHDPALETVSSNTVARGNTPIETNASHAPESSQPGAMFAQVAVSKAFEPAAESKPDTSTSDSSPTASSDSDSSSASSFDDDSTSSSESNSDSSSSYTSDSSSDSSTTSSSDSSDEVQSSVPVRPGVRCQPQHAETWVTRKETRFCHPLPKNLIFHLKRFEYSTELGRVEKLCGSFHVPEEIDLSEYCLEQRDQLACGSAINETRICQCGDRFRLTGAIVHVDPLDDSDDLAYGDIPEGHYVTYISQPYYSEKSGEIKYKWVEVDDDRVRSVHHHNSGIVSEKSHSTSVESCFQNGEGQTNDVRAALKIIDGCNTYVSSGSRLKAAAKKSSVKEKERRYAYLVVYSRVCSCNNRKSNV